MIAGTVTPNREARVDLTVFSAGGQRQQVEAMVDTGFNLFLTLPSSLIAALGLPFAVPAKATLADHVVSLNCYWVTLLWDGQPRGTVTSGAGSVSSPITNCRHRPRGLGAAVDWGRMPRDLRTL